MSRTAWTEAERRSPVSSASSPIAAPGPRNRSVRPSSATTRTRPRSTTKSSRASSPSRSAHSPAWTRSGSASAESAASETSSAPARSGTPASTDAETPVVLIARPTASADRTPSVGCLIYAGRVEFGSIDELEGALRDADYLPERGLSTALYLALVLSKPVLLEGEAGVGKTEAAKALATVLGARLIRLQCYEGLDVAHAVYEWNYPRQLLHIRAAQEGTVREEELFGPEYLIRRPLLEAIDSDEPVVLLIDEIDRADEEFEAFLLEVLSDFQITIPGARHDLGASAPGGDPDLEPHARAARRPEATGALPLDRPSVARA